MEQKKLEKPVVLDKERMAPWRKGIDEKYVIQIAEKKPFCVEPLKDYLNQGNSAIVDKVAKRIESNGPLLDLNPQKKNYEIGEKECPDARSATADLELLLRLNMVHERTAGNVVRQGWLYKVLAQDGIGIVKGHMTCGACEAAHAYNNDERPPVDDNILAIMTSIPPYVRSIADHAKRDRENAKIQAVFGRNIVKDSNRSDVYVFPAFYDWTSEQKLEWLKRSRAPSEEITKVLGHAAQRMTGYALAEARDFGSPHPLIPKQFAALSMIYDPFRLGQINDPRVIFGALGNEMFCVTENFRPFDTDARGPRMLSRTAMGSVMYAGYDMEEKAGHVHYGHVGGVGGADGTHILGIMDVSEQVLLNVKMHILAKYPLIKQLTDDGQKILLIKYDKQTAKAEFIDG